MFYFFKTLPKEGIRICFNLFVGKINFKLYIFPFPFF